MPPKKSRAAKTKTTKPVQRPAPKKKAAVKKAVKRPVARRRPATKTPTKTTKTKTKPPTRGSKATAAKPKAPASPPTSASTPRRSSSSLAKHERNDVIVRRATTGGVDGKGESLSDIARDYEISYWTVRDIVKRRLGAGWKQDAQARARKRNKQRQAAARAAGIKAGKCVGCGVRAAKGNWDKCSVECARGLKAIEGLKNPSLQAALLNAKLVLSGKMKVTAEDKVWARKVVLAAKTGDVPVGLCRAVWADSDGWRLIEERGLKRWLPRGVQVLGRVS